MCWMHLAFTQVVFNTSAERLTKLMMPDTPLLMHVTKQMHTGFGTKDLFPQFL